MQQPSSTLQETLKQALTSQNDQELEQLLASNIDKTELLTTISSLQKDPELDDISMRKLKALTLQKQLEQALTSQNDQELEELLASNIDKPELPTAISSLQEDQKLAAISSLQMLDSKDGRLVISMGKLEAFSAMEQYVKNMMDWYSALTGEVVGDETLEIAEEKNKQRMKLLKKQISTLDKIKVLHDQRVDQKKLDYIQRLRLPDPIAFFPRLIISLVMGIRKKWLDRNVPNVSPKELGPGVLEVLKTIRRHQRSLEEWMLQHDDELWDIKFRCDSSDLEKMRKGVKQRYAKITAEMQKILNDGDLKALSILSIHVHEMNKSVAAGSRSSPLPISSSSSQGPRRKTETSLEQLQRHFQASIERLRFQTRQVDTRAQQGSRTTFRPGD